MACVHEDNLFVCKYQALEQIQWFLQKDGMGREGGREGAEACVKHWDVIPLPFSFTKTVCYEIIGTENGQRTVCVEIWIQFSCVHFLFFKLYSDAFYHTLYNLKVYNLIQKDKTKGTTIYHDDSSSFFLSYWYCICFKKKKKEKRVRFQTSFDLFYVAFVYFKYFTK